MLLAMAEPVMVRRLTDEEGHRLRRLVRRGEGKGKASVVRYPERVLAFDELGPLLRTPSAGAAGLRGKGPSATGPTTTSTVA